MDQNILLSKIVATPTETTWSQAYSTLNLYVVLSLENQGDESIVTKGKELLEKIQREYFSLDEKNLSNIKKSVENALEGVEKESASITLGTIHEDNFYIIIAGKGEVVLKRGGKIGIIAKGDSSEISAFSGNITNDDIIVLETNDFATKIPAEKLSGLLNSPDVSEVSENIAPLIHEESKGTEAAIIIQYKNIESSVEEKLIPPTQEESIEEIGHEENSKFKLPTIRIPDLRINLKTLSRRNLILIAIIALVVILVGSIFIERVRQESDKRNKVLLEILTPAQKRFDDAVSLISLNKGLAYEEFDSIKTTLEEARSKFDPKSSEIKKIDEFIGKVEEKIGELGAGSTISNQKTLLENVNFVSARSGLVAIDENGKIYILSKSGDKDKTFDSKNLNAKSFISDDKSIYVLGDNGITRTNKSTGSTTTIVKNPDGVLSIDIFGTNIYGLNTKDKTVDKFSGESKSSYFTESVKLNNPSDLTIDSSVYVLDGSKIRKFTRGEEDSFSIQGITGEIGINSKIFTSPDFTNIYVLDPKNARIISIKKDGEFNKQYSWKNLSTATSFSVDEENETIYVVSDSKLYSFDL